MLSVAVVTVAMATVMATMILMHKNGLLNVTLTVLSVLIVLDQVLAENLIFQGNCCYSCTCSKSCGKYNKTDNSVVTENL